MVKSFEKYYPVISLSQLTPGKGMKIKLKKFTLAIFYIKDKIYAVQNRCPHQHADLSDGYILNDKLYCSLHHWAFNLSDGRYVFNPEMKLKTYKTKIKDGMIYIRLD